MVNSKNNWDNFAEKCLRMGNNWRMRLGRVKNEIEEWEVKQHGIQIIIISALARYFQMEDPPILPSKTARLTLRHVPFPCKPVHTDILKARNANQMNHSLF